MVHFLCLHRENVEFSQYTCTYATKMYHPYAKLHYPYKIHTNIPTIGKNKCVCVCVCVYACTHVCMLYVGMSYVTYYNYDKEIK